MSLPCERREEEPLLLRSASKLRASNFMTQEEYIQTIASRVLYSRSCGAFYISLLIASLTEIIWILHPWMSAANCCQLAYPRSRVFFLVETYLTVGLAGETTLRILWLRGRFWQQCGNVFDAAVSALSLLSFILYVDDLSQDLEIVVLGLMGCWIALRLLRLLTVAKNLHSQRRQAAQALDVNFAAEAADFITAADETAVVCASSSAPTLLELSLTARSRERPHLAEAPGSPASDGDIHDGPYEGSYTIAASHIRPNATGTSPHHATRTHVLPI
uniref:Ion transport domain-containing protein n=1 Tax=Chrysotila carterae TaxID=13221 RepID=A0A7S4C244_CHRCT